jgi:hypothetical protein
MSDEFRPPARGLTDQEFIRRDEEADRRAHPPLAPGLDTHPAPGCIQEMVVKLAAIKTAALNGDSKETIIRLTAEAEVSILRIWREINLLSALAARPRRSA